MLKTVLYRSAALSGLSFFDRLYPCEVLPLEVHAVGVVLEGTETGEDPVYYQKHPHCRVLV